MAKDVIDETVGFLRLVSTSWTLRKSIRDRALEAADVIENGILSTDTAYANGHCDGVTNAAERIVRVLAGTEPPPAGDVSTFADLLHRIAAIGEWMRNAHAEVPKVQPSAHGTRIQELLEANNGYLERARSSEEEAKRLRRILHLVDEMSATKSGDPRLGQIRTVAIHALAGGDIHVFEFAR